MSVIVDPSGHRKVVIEAELAATPEQVWHALATGPGITSWFLPTEVEEREGGAMVFHLMPGMDSPAVVTAWEPPHRFGYEEREWNPGAPPVATEVVIEARSGGTCVMRMVHSLFTSKEDWDDQLEGFEKGWRPFMVVLQHYLTRFFGQRPTLVRAQRTPAVPEAEGWSSLAAGLGLDGAAAGQRWATPPGPPRLAGVIDQVGERNQAHEVIAILDAPAPGVALISTYTWGDQAYASLSLYLFGEPGAAVADSEAAWQSWFDERFPADEAPGS